MGERTINWLTIRDCSCTDGRIESDHAPGTFYPCYTCNPNWSRISFEARDDPKMQNAKNNERRFRRERRANV